jgi:hypothetical protein
VVFARAGLSGAVRGSVGGRPFGNRP